MERETERFAKLPFPFPPGERLIDNAKEKRGTGIARKMLEQIFEQAKQSGNRYIVVETLTAPNVPMYEHFGFELKEVYKTKNGKLTEYRMLKQI